MTWHPHLRIFVLSLALVLAGLNNAFGSEDWEQFKTAFITNGRVIDKGQNGISHTEGQGMALLLAVQNDDQKTLAAK
jgi:endoglucanase